jgi:small neutral amino acid transporter SnatA (MarC family)
MLTAAAYIKILVALTVVVNPFGIIPAFVAMTAQQSVIRPQAHCAHRQPCRGGGAYYVRSAG